VSGKKGAVHRNKRKTVPAEDRFWLKVSGGSVEECWIWTGGNVSPLGYATFRATSRGRSVPTHRFAYEHLRAEIPYGLELDHLCRDPRCVNPWHLEPVTHKVNMLRSNAPTGINARKTHCLNGHEFSAANTRIRPDGHRSCRACKAAQERDRRLLLGAFAQGTHCKKGHEFALDGVTLGKDGRYYCVACRTSNRPERP
jgi:hypothetical protein